MSPTIEVTARQLLTRGLTFHRAGRLTEAASHYREALHLQPRLADALYLLGLIIQQEGNHPEAIDLFARSTAANAKLGKAHLQRGFSLQSLQRTEESISAFRAAIAQNPALAEAHHQLGNALARQGREAEALPLLCEATRLAPNDAIIWLSRGMACFHSRKTREAVESFQQAVRLQPDLAEAQEILGQAFRVQGRFEEARQQFNKALKLRPDLVEARHDLGRLSVDEGRLTEAVAHFRAVLAVKFESATYTNLLHLLHYLPESTPEVLFAEHRRWGERVEAPLRPLWRPHDNEKSPQRRLRIGFVSPDLRDHPVARFLEPIIANHNREHFEVFCYADLKAHDSVTERLRRHAGQWRDTIHLTDEQLAALILEDRIDILVDLAGHTTNHRLLAFARKPAPVQITWMGYPDTTGLNAMDYRLTDAITDPPGQTERWHSEKLVRLPETFLCDRPPAYAPDVAPLPALAAGHITFGCLNNFRKISSPCAELWSRVLRETPTARLLLKFPGSDHSGAGERLIKEFVRGGVAAERIELHRTLVPNDQYHALYHGIDVALDPFPYNGTTNTCDALWMGVPVVTLAGRSHVGRVGASLVSNVGYPGWVCQTPDEYAAACRDLAGDVPRLAKIRHELRERMRLSPLCDEHRFIGHLESALRALWVDWCQKTGPNTPLPSQVSGHRCQAVT